MRVAKFFVSTGRVFGFVGELFDHLADVRIFAAAHEALRPHADFGAAVTAKDGAVLNEGNFQAHASRRNRTTHAAVAAADHDEVKLAHVFGRGGEPKRGLAPRGERRGVVERNFLQIAGEINRIATPVEAGEVAECERGFGCGDLDRAAVVPEPRGALHSEGFGERLAIDK